MSLENSAPISSTAPNVSQGPGAEAPASLESAPISVPEPKAPEAPAPKPNQLSSGFAALARRERELQKREADLKAQREDPTYKEYVDAKNSRNPIKALQALGFTYEQATEHLLNEGKETPEDAIKKLQQRLDDKEKAELEKQSKAEQDRIEKTLNDFRQSIREHVDSSEDTYELIRANEAYDTVYDVIEEYHATNGKVLTVAEAAAHVESYLEERARKLLSLKKLAPKPAPEATATATTPPTKDSPPKTDAKTAPTASPTLTNSQVIASAPTLEDTSHLSDEELTKRVAARLQARLAAEKQQRK